MAQAANYPNRYAQQPSKPASEAVTGAAMNFSERKDPQKYEFGDGVMLQGTLTNVERVQVRDQKNGLQKSANRYTVQEVESGEPVFFFGTHQLDTKLRPSDVGHVIVVTCEGEDKSVSRNGNAMKIFKVMVSDRKAPGWASDGTPITAEDVAF
jgi:hypothetical protein